MTDEEPTPAEPEPTPTGSRAKNLYYVGETDPASGEPVAFVMGIPATDLDEAAIRNLTDNQYDTAIKSGIYQKSKPKAS